VTESIIIFKTTFLEWKSPNINYFIASFVSPLLKAIIGPKKSPSKQSPLYGK
jgi:hypothetical protein